MALTYGFYNSVNGDRKYDADQMSAIYDGVIHDGVFPNVGDIFAVKQSTGMTVTVASGRAWFNRTWTYLDVPMPVTLTAAHPTLPRIDAIVIEVDKRDSVRANFIKVVTGTPATVPKRPTMTNAGDIYQHPLAFITVPKAATAISQSNITMAVGLSECPFVTSILETTDIDALFAQWDAQFNEWFDNVQSQLEGNVVTNLQMQIDQRLKITSKATLAEIKNGATVDKWSTPKIIHDALNDRVGYFAPSLGTLLFTDTRTVTFNGTNSTSIVAKIVLLGGAKNDYAKLIPGRDLLLLVKINSFKAAVGVPYGMNSIASRIDAIVGSYYDDALERPATSGTTGTYSIAGPIIYSGTSLTSAVEYPLIYYFGNILEGDSLAVNHSKSYKMVERQNNTGAFAIENNADPNSPRLGIMYKISNGYFSSVTSPATASITTQLYMLSGRAAL